MNRKTVRDGNTCVDDRLVAANNVIDGKFDHAYKLIRSGSKDHKLVIRIRRKR